jgi:hypothetical protein
MVFDGQIAAAAVITGLLPISSNSFKNPNADYRRWWKTVFYN